MNLLIVDDEILISKYIVHCIQESGSNDKIYATVASAKDALDILKKVHIDLVMTDISMPETDGLELLRMIKERYPAVIVIMLTCHDEFNLARTALQHNADGYVLKSELTPELMRKTLDDAKAERLKSELSQAISQVKRMHYVDQILGEANLFSENGSAYADPFRADGLYFSICFNYHLDYIDKIVKNLEIYCEDIHVYQYGHHTNILLILLAEDNGNVTNLTSDLNRKMQEISSTLNINIGFSRIFKGEDNISHSINESIDHLNQQYYRNTGSQNRDIAESYSKRNRELERLFMLSADMIDRGQAVKFSEKIHEILAFAKNNHPDFSLLKSKLYEQIQSANKKFQTAIPQDQSRIIDSKDFCTLASMVKEEVRRIAAEYHPYSKNVQSAIDYVNLHYTEDLSLQEVSDCIFINRDYLSRQFKNQVGISFSEYVSSLRMEKAKNLLIYSRKSISEIALEVGVPNLSYFSTLFRKQFGITPTNMRKNADNLNV